MNNKIDHRRQEVQQTVKNACDQLNQEGVDARNYVEQLAWLFFLKAFDEAEARREQEAAFDDKSYERRLTGEYAWSSWAKDTDHPDQMLEFASGKLWTKLTSPDPKKGLGNDALGQRFRRIFENVRNYCRRGITFARVVQQVDKLHFSDDTDVHVLSEIYEDLLKRVAADSAGYAESFIRNATLSEPWSRLSARSPGSAYMILVSALPVFLVKLRISFEPPDLSAGVSWTIFKKALSTDWKISLSHTCWEP
jgi:type I restriction enzyme M protein